MKAFFLSALTGAALLTASSAAAQTLEWTFNNNYAATRVESALIRDFAADVGARSGGKFTIRVLEGGAMNLRDADALRWMQQGKPEIGFIWSPFLGRDAPDLASLYVYGSVANAEEHMKALPALKEILTDGMKRWQIEPVGFMGLSLLEASLFCRQPVRSLDELKKVKLRVGTREQVDTFKALGVAAQIVPQNELYAAIQTGVIDCALYPARIAHTVSLQEVAKHATPTGFPFPPTPYVIMANKGAYAALSAENKKVLADAAASLEANSFDFSKDAQEESAARERLKGQGVTMYEPLSKADQEALRGAALKTWDTIMKEAGATGTEYRGKVLQALGRAGN
ncbi:MAG TPA: TRAP transporter substrate-binding protein DctP [Microvirga sp.]|jgi:TRAP-type C4-dicarboxylate transport system substrate-binding protein|nr:TRAP transporter substrate-binding protein DctP [Microvirga sp.]